jgi:internalin A
LRGEFLNLKEVLPTNLATNRGLTEIKNAIQQYINKLPHVGTPLPKIWVRVRSDLENDSRNYISLEEYYNLCKLNSLTKREDMLVLSRYLHDLGVCLHFQDDPTFKHYIILKPEWVTTAVYKVLDNKTVIKKLGCFTQENLAEIWKDDEYIDMRDELLQLMMRFKLCYPIPNCVGQYIAPQLLDINQPEYDWDKSHNLILRYKYEFMPKGIITRFIVETHPWIEEQKQVWRSGVILNKNKTRAEVIENYNQKEIKIRVTGNRKKELLTVITHELEKIHFSFERLKYDTLVPCNCEKCIGSDNPYTYPLNELQEFLTDCAYDIQCRISRKMADVRRLIDDVNLPTQESNWELLTPVTPLQRKLDKQKEKSFNEIHINVQIDNQVENKKMTNSNDSSRKIEIGSIGRDLNASGQALNLGEISGTVTNTINKLQSAPEPEKPGIKEILTQLQTAIEADTELTAKDKEKALKQVKALAEAAQNPQEKQDLADTAITMLKGVLSSLPTAAKLVEQCSRLLPIISTFLGLG